MRSQDREEFEVHAKLSGFRRKVEEAEGFIEEASALCENPYVSFSAGKDSSALLHLVLKQRPDIAVRTLASGETRLLHGNYEAVISWWRERHPEMHYEEILIDRVFAEGWEDATWAEQRATGNKDLQTGLAGDFDGVFLGLRKEESKGRKITLSGGREVYRYVEHRNDENAGRVRCCPLAHFTTRDVGAVMVENDLPLLKSYEEDGGLENRTTLRLTGRSAEENAVRRLKMRDGKAYNRLVRRFPEIAAWA